MYVAKDKKEYEMTLGEMKLPILPENLKEICQMDNKKYDTFGAGERVLPGKEKLHTWTVSSYFPADGAIEPSRYREYYTSLVQREDNKLPEPIDFFIVRYNENGSDMLPINTPVLFESMEWEDRKGEPGDIYYTFKLIEYKEFKTTTA